MSVKLQGADKLITVLSVRGMVKANITPIVRVNGAELQTKAQRNSPVRTGNLRRSIMLSLSDGGMTAIVHAGAEYAPYVEYGTRLMNAQPYLRPAFNEQKDIFIRDINKVLGE